MLTSISPVGEAARRQRWWLTAGAYLVGSLLGGTAVGALAGGVGASTLGWLRDTAALAVLAVVLVLGLALDLAGRVPTWHRQVDERWLGSYRGWVYGLGYGAQLGAGVVTIASGTQVYVTLAAAVLSRSLSLGALLGAVFGLARGLPLLSGAGVRTAAALRARLAAVDRWRRPATLATRAGQAIVAAAALALAL